MNIKRQRAPSFKLEIPGDATVKQRIMDKITRVRTKLSTSAVGSVNHADILETLLDSWLDEAPVEQPGSYHTATQPLTNTAAPSGGLYMTTKSSLQRLVNLTHAHSRTCKSAIHVTDIKRRGHVALLKMQCRRHKRFSHKFWWASSPMLPNHRYYVNEKVMHATMFSGMRPSHYTRFATGANMGVIKKDVRKKFLESHVPFLEDEYRKSTETALLEEVACYDMDSTWNGIDVCTDARHGHRRNAKDTSMVAIGDRSKKVLGHFHITKERDPCTQRHEKHGVADFYEYMESKEVPINLHIHDRNMGVNGYINIQDGPINQNDRWHGIKHLKKAIEKISKGTKRDQGKKWHEQLQDKVESIGTHAHWAIEH